jgi:peptidyl-prolyl cis-trans isomerase D
LYNAKKAANIEYVQVPYYNQPDSLFPVTDAELKEYYNKNINAFNQKEEQRVIKVLSFAITPSAQDYAETEAWINDLKNDFATSADYVAINNQNSDVPYQGIAVSEKNVDADLKAFAFSGKAGDVFGPTLFGNTYKMARIVETGILAPDSVKVRHILVQDADAEKTQQLADSLVAVLKGGADFATVAKEYSLAGTAQNGGELGWFKEGEIDLEFSKACFAAKPKEFFTFPMGGAIQIAQVTETTKPVQKVKLCVLQRKVEAGSQTYGAIYGQASAYVAQNNTATAFVDSAKAEQGLYIRTYTIGKNDARVGNLEDSRQLIRWAFGKKAGNVTDEVYECGKNFVVAMVDQVIPAGTKSFETVKTQVKAAVIQDKKGDKIIEDMKAAGENIAALGAVASAQNVSLSSTFIPNIGREPMVAGCIPALLATKQIQYVKGSIGVFAIRLVSEVPQGEFNAAAEITEYTNRNPFVYTTFESLKNSAEIIDNRINFY